ncbi:MAG: hypothetical protein ABII27_01450 [bacterium]
MKISIPSKVYESIGWILISICVLTLVVPFLFAPKQLASINLRTEKSEYFHNEFIDVEILVGGTRLRSRLIKENIAICVKKDNLNVKNIGDRTIFYARYNKKTKNWRCLWPCPWNAEDGTYTVVIDKTLTKLDGISKESVINYAFKIKRRELKPIEKGFSVLSFENNREINSLKIKDPNGTLGDWRNIFKWTEFINADCFLQLASQTYYNTPLKESFPWYDYNLKHMKKMGAEAHKNGILFGAYIMAYLTFGNKEFAPEYNYAIDYDYKTKSLFTTRSISLNDEKRIDDIVEIVKRLNKVREIDFIGIDYIRNALGGYELVDEFVSEMEVDTPDGWDALSYESRMKWLAGKKILRKDFVLIDQWQWWRAHKSASIVKRIINESGIKKPLWAFTLSWDKGWEHGQDPVMMADAGVDYDGVMLYEADREQFDELINKWNSYLKSNQANIVVGNVIDWVLHQKTYVPSGPDEYVNRTLSAIRNIYADAPCRSVFVHDLSRALWGRKGTYSTVEWMLASGKIITSLKQIYGLLDLDCILKLNFDNKVCSVKLINKNADQVKEATLEVYSNYDLTVTLPLDKGPITQVYLSSSTGDSNLQKIPQMPRINDTKNIVTDETSISSGTSISEQTSLEGNPKVNVKLLKVDLSNNEKIDFEISFKTEDTGDREGNHFIAVRVEYNKDDKTESLVAMEYFKKEDTEINLSGDEPKNNGIIPKQDEDVQKDLIMEILKGNTTTSILDIQMEINEGNLEGNTTNILLDVEGSK